MENKRVLSRLHLHNNLPAEKRFNIRDAARVGKIRKALCELVAVECTTCTRFTLSTGTTNSTSTAHSKGTAEAESQNLIQEQLPTSEHRPEYDDDAIFKKLLSADLKDEQPSKQSVLNAPPARQMGRALPGNRPKRRERTTDIGALENIPQPL